MLNRAKSLADKVVFHSQNQATAARRRHHLRGTTRTVLESLENRRLLADILGSASAYAVLGGSTVTNTGATQIVGNLGVSPGTAITGFPPGIVTGTINAGDPSASQAQTDLATAYGILAAEPVTTNLTGQDLGGLTLTPGVYNFNNSAQLSGTLTLDAQGNPNARFDFEIGTTFTTASASTIVIINGGNPENVYFRVGSSATLGSGSAFEGNILAHQSVTLNSGASLESGRAFAVVGAVTMDSNQVSSATADVSVTNTIPAGPVAAGNNLTYTLTVANSGPSDAQNVALSDVVPTGTTFVSAAQTSGPAFTLTSPSSGGTGTLVGTIGTLPSEDSATFAVVVHASPSDVTHSTISNAATLTTTTNDPDTDNNSQTVATSVGSSLSVVSVMPTTSTTSDRRALSILGLDTTTGNDSGLTYTWSVALAPSGAKRVIFNENGTHAAKRATARFQKAGTYHLLCTVSNGDESVSRLVSITIKQVATSLRLAPHHRVITAGDTLQYSAEAMDQFDHEMRTTPTTTYAVQSGRGTINDTGLFSAGQIVGHAVIQMTDDGLSGVLGATVV